MVVIYQAFVIFMAWSDSVEIKAGRPVSHSTNATSHILAACFAYGVGGWWNAAVLLLATKTVFDLSLNTFRADRPLFYIPDKPDSVLDKAERFVFFGSGAAAKLCYVATILLIKIYTK